MSKSSCLLTLFIILACFITFGCGGGTRGTNGPKNRIIMGTVTNQESIQIENFSATITVDTDGGEFQVSTDPETGFYQIEIEVQNDELFSIRVNSEIFSERSFMIEPAGEEDVISANFEFDGKNVNLVTEQNSTKQVDENEKEQLPTAASSPSTTIEVTASVAPTPVIIPDSSSTEEPELFTTRFFGFIDSQYAPLNQSSISIAVSTGILSAQTDTLGRYQLETTREAALEQITISIASADVRKSFSIGIIGPVESYNLDFAIDQNGEVSITDRSTEGNDKPSPSPSSSSSPSISPSPSPSPTPKPIEVPDQTIKPTPIESDKNK